ncbi:MAG: endonuclease domain-containing protein [Desmonostoc geniculatum HA4340-LM1]|nr:endonuclease domain-containing protein [Desmonostoc geniculatum HA4340-LM1]
MSKQKRSNMERVCEYCQNTFLTPTKGKNTARFCSRTCVGKARYSIPEVREKHSLTTRQPLVQKACLWCGQSFQMRQNKSVNQKRKFCSKSCANTMKANQPQERERSRQRVKFAYLSNIGRKRPDASQRMRENNPTKNPATLLKMSLSMKGKTFLARGGNSKITEPQMKLATALLLTDYIEYPISTSSVKHLFPSLPPCYKVDIAYPEKKLVIEVDGKTHKLKKQKFLDKRKTEVLNALGWSVLRFWNEEILNDLESVLLKVKQFIT